VTGKITGIEIANVVVAGLNPEPVLFIYFFVINIAGVDRCFYSVPLIKH